MVALTALLCLGAALSAHAQGNADLDPPDRVARLGQSTGQVWLFSPDANEWLAVERNRPLTTGDRIATDNGANAEITLGSTTLRLDSATELEIVLLDDRLFNLHLHSGSVAARLRNAPSVAEFALETDEGRFRALGVGRYRFDRFEQASNLTVEAGQAVFEGRNSALTLGTGQHAQFWLDTGGAPQYSMLEPARDDFAAWNAERDRAEARPVASVRYVSPEMTGVEDLDRYGQWEQSPEYGPIWTPRAVDVGWAPYSAGHWTYVRPWGWTWVDDAPWGFAPFHYGRWVHYRNRWCWAPGRYVARPVYAPALVAWIGGPRASVSITIGGGTPVGWFPLAPREVYVPSYRHSSRYVRNINVTHVTNVTQITTIVNNTNGAADRRDFANRRFPHAVTVVPATVLTGRQPVAREAARYRGDPRIRALVGDVRPAATTIAAPVASPPAPARPPSGRVVVTRPPFEGRAPGLSGRPGQERSQDRRNDRGQDRGNDRGQDRGNDRGQERGNDRGQERGNDRGQERGNDRGQERGNDRGQERGNDRGNDRGQERAQQGPSAAPQAGATPQGTPAPTTGGTPGRPNAPAAGGARPAQAVPVPGRPDSPRAATPRPEAGRPGQAGAADPAVVERPRGGPRDADGDGRGGPRDAGRGSEARPPQPNAAPQPNVPVTPVAPPPSVQAAPPTPPPGDRGRNGRRDAGEDSRPPARPGAIPAPQVTGNAPVARPPGRGSDSRGAESPSGRGSESRGGEPQRAAPPRAPEQSRAVDSARPPPTTRAAEPRPADAPRPVSRVESPRAPDAPRAAPSPRAAEPPRAAAPAATRPPDAKPEPAKVESPRPTPEQRGNRSEKRETGEKREQGEKQR